MKRCPTTRASLLSLFWLLLFLLNGCASLPHDYPRPVSSALDRPEETRLGKTIQAQAVNHPGASGFHLLPTAVNAFSARARLIDGAEKTLDLHYFIFHIDHTGKFLLNRIIAAAERGVRVRLLVDDWFERGEFDWWLALAEIHPNIVVRVFNPFGSHRSNPLARSLAMVFGPKRLRGRMHNKAFIVDNSMAIVGGRNIGDEYFGASRDFNFHDLDIMGLGPVTRETSAVFDDYWNCELSVPIKALMARRPAAEDLQTVRRDLETRKEFLGQSTNGFKVGEPDLLKRVEAGKVPLVWAQGEVLSDHPLKCLSSDDPERSLKMARKLKTVIEEAQSEVLMISPYFVPGKVGMRWFKKMRDRGVTIRIITNSFRSTDSPMAQIGYMHYRKELLRLGVELYELKSLPEPQSDKDRSQLGGDLIQLCRPLIQIGSSFIQAGRSLLQIGGSLLQLSGPSRGALHAKTVVLDRQVVFVGSFNLDPRSVRLDTQNGIVIRSTELAEQVACLFATDTSPSRTYRVMLQGGDDLVWVDEKNGQEVQYTREPMSRFWNRVTLRFLSWFVPESVL